MADTTGVPTGPQDVNILNSSLNVNSVTRLTKYEFITQLALQIFSWKDIQKQILKSQIDDSLYFAEEFYKRLYKRDYLQEEKKDGKTYVYYK